MLRTLLLVGIGLASLFLPPPTWAEQAQQFDRYTIHYSVVSTTFIAPETASRYQMIRAKDQAFINIAVREQLEDGSSRAVTARLEGRTWDLFQNQFFEFRKIAEQDAIYYIDSFQFSSAELRFFDIQILPEGAKKSFNLKFQNRVYED